MVIVLMQVKTGSDAPKFSYVLPFSYKSGMVSINIRKYSKSFIEIILFPVSCAMTEYLEIIFWFKFKY